MESHNPQPEIMPVRDGDHERPIPSAWRPVLKEIVDALVRHDYRLERAIAGVAPVSAETATQIREAIEDYGDALVALPDEAWDTSVCIWMDDHWNAMVDLWTDDEGASDLVLRVRVFEAGGAYMIDVYMVYVP